MLSNLLIKNYALIRQLEMQPSTGLNVITGETGAGKSIMLGAIGLLMGKRADTKVLLQKQEKCIIEGTFDIDNYSLGRLFEEKDWEYDRYTIIRREISASGKSRAFINDSPVNLDALRSLGEILLDVHSQHDTQRIGGQQFQLQVLDVFGSNRNVLERYRQTYRDWNELKATFTQLDNQARQQQNDSDYKSFLLNELDAMALAPTEQDQLEESLQVMEHAEEIKIQIQNSLQALGEGDHSATELMATVNQMLKKIQGFAPVYQSVQQRIESILIELKDVVEELRSLDGQVEHKPDEIEHLKSRLDAIYRLQKKHGVDTVSQLIEIQDQLQNESEELTNLDGMLAELKQQIETTEAEMINIAAELSERRQSIFPQFKKNMEELLSKLGMPDSVLEMAVDESDPGPNGIDDIQWLFSANKGIAPQPISKVASGGEFSRLMFCVKYLMADKMALPTILFDEIDAGISGEVSLQMIEMMEKMSTNHQVLTISHLPQFAARGDHHYYVYKDRDESTTTSIIKKLDGTERIREIAKMLGGNDPSEIAFANAKELMGTLEQ